MKKVLAIMLVMLGLWLWGAETLTLEEAQAAALKNNPELKASEASLHAAKKSLQSSYLGFGPSASLNYNKFYFNPGTSTGLNTLEETSSLQFSASQPVFNGGKIYLGNQLTKNAYRISEETYRSKLLEIYATTEIKFYSVQSNKQMVIAMEKTLEQSIVNLEIAQAKYEAGIISKADLLQLESSKLSNELNLINLQNALEISKIDLANYIGIIEDIEVEEFSIGDYSKYIETLQNIDSESIHILQKELLQLGLNNNPALKISQIATDTADKSLMMAGGNLFPSLNLSYSYNWENSNINSDLSESSTFGIIASIPIFPIADNVLDYQASKYDLRNSEEQEKSTKNAIDLAVRSSILNLITAAKSVESARVSKEYAWETWSQMRERFEQGLVSASDLLSTEALVTTSDHSYINSQQDFLTSLSNLTQLLGMEDNKELLNLIEKMEE